MFFTDTNLLMFRIEPRKSVLMNLFLDCSQSEWR